MFAQLKPKYKEGEVLTLREPGKELCKVRINTIIKTNSTVEYGIRKLLKYKTGKQEGQFVTDKNGNFVLGGEIRVQEKYLRREMGEL